MVACAWHLGLPGPKQDGGGGVGAEQPRTGLGGNQKQSVSQFSLGIDSMTEENIKSPTQSHKNQEIKPLSHILVLLPSPSTLLLTVRTPFIEENVIFAQDELMAYPRIHR